jgi:hypothetical protein
MTRQYQPIVQADKSAEPCRPFFRVDKKETQTFIIQNFCGEYKGIEQTLQNGWSKILVSAVCLEKPSTVIILPSSPEHRLPLDSPCGFPVAFRKYWD